MNENTDNQVVVKEKKKWVHRMLRNFPLTSLVLLSFLVLFIISVINGINNDLTSPEGDSFLGALSANLLIGGILVDLIRKSFKKKSSFTKESKSPFWKSFGRGIILAIEFILLIVISFFITPKGYLESALFHRNNEVLRSYESGDFDGALSSLEKSLDIVTEPSDRLEVLKAIGYLLQDEGRYDEALEKFNEALESTEDPFQTELISGEMAYIKEDYENAEKHYLNAYNLNQNDFEINILLSAFYLDIYALAPEFQDYKRALSHAQKANSVAVPEVRDTSLQALGVAYHYNEDYEKALKIFHGQDLNNPDVLYWIGVSYIGTGDREKAIEYLKKSDELGAELPEDMRLYIKNVESYIANTNEA